MMPTPNRPDKPRIAPPAPPGGYALAAEIKAHNERVEASKQARRERKRNKP